MSLPLILRRRRSPSAVIALFVLLFALGSVVFGAHLFPDATTTDPFSVLLPPGTSGHLLGTDRLGRDVLALGVAGAFSALIGPLVIETGSMTIAIVVGLIAGYKGGVADFIIGRFGDLFFALPVILMALVVGGIFGGGYWMLVAVLAVLYAPSDMRIVRAAVLEQAPRGYVNGAKMLGLSSLRIMFVHILPNIRKTLLTQFLLNFSSAILALSSLSYLGIGVSSQAADWGRQLSDGQSVMGDNLAALLLPAFLIVAVAWAANTLGDAFQSSRGLGGRSV